MMETRPVALGLIGALTTALGLVLAGALAFKLTPLPERFLPAYAQTAYYVSILCGSALSVSIARKKGLLHGLSIAALVFCRIGGIALFWHMPGYTLDFIIKRGLLSLLSGAVGSVAGAALIGVFHSAKN
jgi:putative membrane protein (TIGR04086 family)